MQTLTLTEQTPASVRRPAAPNTGAASQRDSEDAALSGSDLGAAFEVLLDTARSAFALQGEASALVSPSQMFEAPVADAHERQQSSMREQYREGAGNNTYAQRHDAASIQARRTSLAEFGSNIDRVSQRESVAESRGAKGSGAAGQVSRDRSDRVAAGSDASRVIEVKFEVTASRGSAPDVASSKNSTANQMFPMEPSAAQAAGAAQGASLASVQSRGAANSSTAGQIAQLLATGRAGEADSPRAVVSQSSTGDARLSTSSRRPAAENLTQPKDSPTESRATRESADAVTRTPFDKLVSSMRLRLGARNSWVRLRLEPPELGRIRVDVRMAGTEIRVKVQAETELARQMLTDRVGRLKASLQQHGIHVERFEVVTNLAGETVDGAPVDQGSPHGHDARGDQTWSGMPTTPRTKEQDVGLDEPGLTAASDGGLAEQAVAQDARLDIRI